MEYLRKFNEFNEDIEYDEYGINMDAYLKYLDIENLEIMIKDYLSYLKDDGFKIEFVEDDDGDLYIDVKKENKNIFDYSDIEDIFSPFLILLTEKYDYDTLKIYINSENINEMDLYEFNDLINQKISPTKIENLCVYIYPKNNMRK